jgi:hypothetical protein
MVTQKTAEKTLAFLLLGLAVLISIIHVWYPIIISPPNISERTGVPVMMTIFAVLAAYGYRWARIGIGFGYVLFAVINLLIAITYFSTISYSQLAQLVIPSLVLGATGILFFTWKGIRVFEEEREKQKPAHL